MSINFSSLCIDLITHNYKCVVYKLKFKCVNDVDMCRNSLSLGGSRGALWQGWWLEIVTSHYPLSHTCFRSQFLALCVNQKLNLIWKSRAIIIALGCCEWNSFINLPVENRIRVCVLYEIQDLYLLWFHFIHDACVCVCVRVS